MILLRAICLALSVVAPPDEAPLPTIGLERIGAARAEVFVGEPVGVRVVVTLDASFRSDQLVPLFRRPLDLPVQIEAPWFESNDLDVVWLDVPHAGANASVAFGDSEALAAFEVRGDEHVFTLERWFVPSTPGRLEFAAPSLRYAYATSFRDDLVAGRVPDDRREGAVTAAPLEWGVRPRPPAPQPATDLGCTGPVTIAVTAARTDAAVGEPFTIALTVQAAHPLHGFVPPASLAAIRGFAVIGTLVATPDPRTRVVTIELERSSDLVDAIPPLEVSAFDPSPPEGHRQLATAAIPLDVELAARESGEGEAVSDHSSAPEVDRRPPAAAGQPWLWALAGLVLGWLGSTWWRRRRSAPARVAVAPSRPAPGPVHDDPTAERTLLAALSTRTGRSREALIGPSLADDLADAGMSRDVAERAAGLLEQLVAARYGGAPVADADRRVDALLDEIDAP